MPELFHKRCQETSACLTGVSKRPAGVEPALPPWQGSRLPLHHGRANDVPNCQRSSSKLAEHRAGVEPALPRYEGGVLPLDHQCRSCPVGPERLELSPARLRAGNAAANTLIPPTWRPLQNPRLLLRSRAVNKKLCLSGPGGARILVPWSSARCYTVSATGPLLWPPFQRKSPLRRMADRALA
jgi:hypothetical protein